MNVKTELLKDHIADFINQRIQDFDIDANKIADTTAILLLSEIQTILKNETLSDFDAVEEIVRVFEQHGILCGNRHDF